MQFTPEDARRLAKGLMEEHGLVLEGWTFAFDAAKARLGMCNYTKKRITLSKHLVATNDSAEIKNTILHEIAHALAGKDAGHGPEWIAVARRIGCSGERCSDANMGVARPHLVRCDCGKNNLTRHKVTKKLLAKRCRHCKSLLRQVS